MMLDRIDATPCPGGLQAYHQRPLDLTVCLGGDNTEDIDFTTEFRASLREIKPRRRQTAIGAKRRAGQVDFVIHEDQEVRTSSGSNLKGSILAKPPQRPRQRVILLPEIKEAGSDSKWLTAESGNEIGPAPSAPRNGTIHWKPASDPVKHEESIKKPARRGTVYIPSDDTTMPSMHMGIFSPIKELQSNSRGGYDMTADLTGLAAQMAKKRGCHTSLVAAPPKRVPLQQPVEVKQESASPRARAGKRTGKENVPPGQLATSGEGELDETMLFDFTQPDVNKLRTNLGLVKAVRPGSRFAGQKPVRMEERVSKETVRSSGYRKPAIPQTVVATHVKEIKRYQNRPSSQPVSSCVNRRSSLQPRVPILQLPLREEIIPARLSVPNIPRINIEQQYSLLSENILDPSLYEDSWLTHQEVAITQLVNSLFQTSKGAKIPPDAKKLRYELLELYQDPSHSLLHKRLQASLLYGALSIPKDVLAGGSRLWTDLGRRERFCSFWLDTYDLTCLTAALEVVIGRECLSGPRISQDGLCSTTTATTSLLTETSNRLTSRTHTPARRDVRTFLETCLIRNEDGSPETEDQDREAWSYHRTLLRSLMLIKLLDMSRAAACRLSSVCLFLPTSSHKSSVSALRAVAHMLNPAIGDVLRLLSYLDYTVDHKQYPLDEFNYHIDNLAIDLRDGVMLTRLVELLLYPTASHLPVRAYEGDPATTAAMRGDETLSLFHGEEQWPLSQHLKFPCLGQATKLYNVQLVLNALTGILGANSLISDVRAEDIVNGFREKTVALLWAITGKWGLALLDWPDVQCEVRRLSTSCQIEYEEYFDGCNGGFEVYKSRLKAWASAVACKHDLEVKNLSTSFSDGRIFLAIVEEYAPYLDSAPGDQAQNLLLHERLDRLGCSRPFVKLFAPVRGVPPGRFFDGDFVVAALAFLCSRLFSTTKRARAAVTIQRGWRQFQERVLAQRQRAGKCVAEQCTAVVHTRERLLWAKTTILKAWRAHASR